MTPQAIIIEDSREKIFFGFIKQFPGICAQGESAKEVIDKINIFFQAYINSFRDKQVEMGPIETLP